MQLCCCDILIFSPISMYVFPNHYIILPDLVSYSIFAPLPYDRLKFGLEDRETETFK